MIRAKISVGLKKGVADPEGANVRKTLQLLNYQNVKEVQTAKEYIIELDMKDEKKAKEKLERMAQKILANPVINSYEISFLK